MSPSERREGYEITAYVESLSGHRFEAGYNDTIKSARLNLDPVFATQRPFFSYFLIFLGNIKSVTKDDVYFNFISFHLCCTPNHFHIERTLQPICLDTPVCICWDLVNSMPTPSKVKVFTCVKLKTCLTVVLCCIRYGQWCQLLSREP